MISNYDQSDFVDSDFQAAQKTSFAAAATAAPSALDSPAHTPTREEFDTKITTAQQRLIELRRAQESLERERAALEESRRRQTEFETGREEMLQHLTRGIGLLEEAEFSARRDAEQMAKTLAAFREALDHVQGIRQETWISENYNVELTKALTTIENARMEWNSAQLKWPLLSGATETRAESQKSGAQQGVHQLTDLSFLRLCKIGLAITWPLVLIALAALGILIATLLGN